MNTSTDSDDFYLSEASTGSGSPELSQSLPVTPAAGFGSVSGSSRGVMGARVGVDTAAVKCLPEPLYSPEDLFAPWPAASASSSAAQVPTDPDAVADLSEVYDAHQKLINRIQIPREHVRKLEEGLRPASTPSSPQPPGSA